MASARESRDQTFEKKAVLRIYLCKFDAHPFIWQVVSPDCLGDNYAPGYFKNESQWPYGRHAVRSGRANLLVVFLGISAYKAGWTRGWRSVIGLLGCQSLCRTGAASRANCVLPRGRVSFVKFTL